VALVKQAMADPIARKTSAILCARVRISSDAPRLRARLAFSRGRDQRCGTEASCRIFWRWTRRRWSNRATGFVACGAACPVVRPSRLSTWRRWQVMIRRGAMELMQDTGRLARLGGDGQARLSAFGRDGGLLRRRAPALRRLVEGHGSR